MSDNSKPPIIESAHGTTTEWCRKLAALNMRENAEIRERVEKLIGVEKARRDYPECYQDGEA